MFAAIVETRYDQDILKIHHIVHTYVKTQGWVLLRYAAYRTLYAQTKGNSTSQGHEGVNHRLSCRDSQQAVSPTIWVLLSKCQNTENFVDTATVYLSPVSICYLDKHLQGCPGICPGGWGLEASSLQKTVHLRQPQHQPSQFTQLLLHGPAWRNTCTNK